MKFVCNKCKTKYSIADQKVRRKVLKIRCKNCSNIIIVREPVREPDRGASAPPRSGAKPLDRALEGAFRRRRGPSGLLSPLPGSAVVDEIEPDEADFDPEPTRLSSVPDFLEDGPPLEDEWYLAVDGNQYGPMGFAELCSRVKRGEAGAEAFVWRDGFDEWMDLNEVPELRPFLPKHPPPPPRGRSGLYPVAALIPPVQPLPPISQSPVPVASPYAPVKPPTAPSVPRVQVPAPPLQPIQPSPTPSVLPAPEPLPQATPFPELAPPPPSQESDLGLLPAAPRLFAEAPALGPIAPSAAPARTPLWMVIAGIGGGLAALCGLFLVGYFLIFDRGERDRQPTQVAMAPAPPPPPPAAEDAGAPTEDNIDFPPLEIARSAKPERSVRSRPRPAAQPSRPSGPTLTASQRRLLELYKDQGNPSATAPTGKAAAKPAARVASRRITPDELLTIQRRHGTELKACYERALKRDDSLTELKAEVTVTIGDTGVVRSVRIRAGNNPDLVSCVSRSIKRWSFPSVGAQTFGFPIIFRGT